MKDAKGHGSNPRGIHAQGVNQIGKPKPTPTIFKKDSDGNVYAAFPEYPSSMNPGEMMSYAHVGQHSSADMHYVSSSKPAKPHEYAPLLSELKSIGYEPKVMSKMTRAHYETRKAKLSP